MDLLINLLTVIIFFGGPILPLLILAIQIGHWHDENADVPIVEAEE